MLDNKIAPPNNIYDVLIIITIVCQAFGAYGAPFFPMRFIAVLSMPFVFVNIRNNFKLKYNYIFLFFCVWGAYSLLSIVWTSNKLEGCKAVFYNFCNFILFFALVFFALKANNRNKSIIIAWILVFSVTIPIALYETITDFHFSVSVQESESQLNLGNNIFMLRHFASFTYGNLNGYVTMIALSLPFILSAIMAFKQFKKQFILWVILLCAIYVLFINSSRGGLLVMTISIVTFIYFSFKSKQINRKYIFFFLIIGLIIFCYYSNVLLEQILIRLVSDSSMFEDTGRFEIYQVTFQVLKDSLFFGSGIGSLQTSMMRISNVIPAAHNMFLEFLTQYGILMFPLFVIWIWRIIKPLLHSTDVSIKLIGFNVLFMLIPFSIINSGYLMGPTIWLFFSSLYILSIKNNNVKTF